MKHELLKDETLEAAKQRIASTGITFGKDVEWKIITIGETRYLADPDDVKLTLAGASSTAKSVESASASKQDTGTSVVKADTISERPMRFSQDADSTRRTFRKREDDFRPPREGEHRDDGEWHPRWKPRTPSFRSFDRR